MLEPAIGDTGQINAIDRMLKVRAPDADGVDRHRDARPIAKRAGDKRDGNSELKSAGQENDLRREWNPRWRDR